MSFVSAAQTKPVSEITRRTANFHPTIWGDYFLKYAYESQEIDEETEEQVERLKEEAKRMLIATASESSDQNIIQLIDTIQRLGISYHFESEICEILEQIKKSVLENGFPNDDLYTISLKFRLLRQEGYNISSDIFKKFTNKEGKFKDELASDVQGMLGLYEAAHFLVHGEPILDEALVFATIHLKSSAKSSNLSPFLAAQVKHALIQTIRKGLPRVEAKHFISIYHEDPSHCEVLLTLAKLDFNILQKLHRKEVTDATRWWKDLDFGPKLPYTRDRLVECCIWGIAIYFEPKYSLGRRIIIKVLSVASLLDDTYDTHGTLEELQIFTDAVHRWDINCINQLPNYMKPIYQTLLDVYNEIDELMVREGKGSYRIHYAKEIMKQFVQSYFDEAKWFHEEYVPTVEEYLNLSTVSTGFTMLSLTYFLAMGDIATEEAFQWVSEYPKITRAGATIARLMDDIVGHKFEQARGHSASSIECYVKQYGATEEEAYAEFRARIAEAWKDINEECLEPRDVPLPLLMLIVDLARLSDALYKHENCYTHSRGIMKDTIKSMFIDPIPM